MEEEVKKTKFATVYNRFLGKVTDDMYVELTPEDTLRDLQNLLIDSIPCFEFPRKNLYNYTIQIATVSSDEITDEDFIIQEDVADEVLTPDPEPEVINESIDPEPKPEEEKKKVKIDTSEFGEELTSEEINILAYLMLDRWLQRQITSIENTRMKYSGSDFKFTSQANHLQKLITEQDKNYQRSFHLQRLYKRRKQDEEDGGKYKSTWCVFGKSVFDEQ